MKRLENIRNNVSSLLNLIYLRFFKLNDSAQKIALGFGLGVFSGMLPATGPVAALFLAALLRVNRASALLGCLLTNTWLSILAFVPAIKVGAVIFGIKWQEVSQEWLFFLKEFKWLSLFKLSALKLLLPVIVGYLIIAFCLGGLAYLIILTIAVKVKGRGK